MLAQRIRDGGHEQRPSTVPTRRPELLALTSVRFLAALEVVLLHTLFALGGKPVRALPATVTQFLTHGGLAVSFFFVLSGFILTYTYCDKESGLRGTPGKFWRARFARIYPLYFLGFVMDAPRVISYFRGSTTSLASALKKIGIAGTAYLTLLQSWQPRVTNSWNTPGWSLSTEAFFYAVFPLLLSVTKRWPSSRLSRVSITLWALPIIAYTVVLATHAVDIDQPIFLTLWRSFPPLRLPEFMLGVAAGRLFLSGRLESHSRALRVSGGFALALILLLPIFDYVLPSSVVENTFGAPLFALAILAVASGAIPTPRWLSAPPLVLLGRASYALYIVHLPFQQVFLKVARLVSLDAPSPGLLIAYLVTVQLFCIGLFLWFEDPIRRLITRAPRH